MTFSRALAVVLLSGGFAAGAAEADCRSDIAAAQKRLAAIAKTQDEHRTDSSPPEEDWFSTRSSADGAEDLLQDARKLARDGEEEGCRSQVRQAERIIVGLESKKQSTD